MPSNPFDLSALAKAHRAKTEADLQQQFNDNVGAFGVGVEDLFGPDSPLTMVQQIELGKGLSRLLEKVKNGDVQLSLDSATPSNSTQATTSSAPTPGAAQQPSAEQVKVAELEKFVSDIASDLGTTPVITTEGSHDLAATRQQVKNAVDRKVNDAKTVGEESAANKLAEAEAKTTDAQAEATELKSKLKPLVTKAKDALASKKEHGPGTARFAMIPVDEAEELTKAVNAVEKLAS